MALCNSSTENTRDNGIKDKVRGITGSQLKNRETVFDNTVPLYSSGHIHMESTNGKATMLKKKKITKFRSWKKSSDCQAA